MSERAGAATVILGRDLMGVRHQCIIAGALAHSFHIRGAGACIGTWIVPFYKNSSKTQFSFLYSHAFPRYHSCCGRGNKGERRSCSPLDICTPVWFHNMWPARGQTRGWICWVWCVFLLLLFYLWSLRSLLMLHATVPPCEKPALSRVQWGRRPGVQNSIIKAR